MPSASTAKKKGGNRSFRYRVAIRSVTREGGEKHGKKQGKKKNTAARLGEKKKVCSLLNHGLEGVFEKKGAKNRR